MQAGLEDLTEVVQGDFLAMPFPDNSFDAVFSVEATCHAGSVRFHRWLGQHCLANASTAGPALPHARCDARHAFLVLLAFVLERGGAELECLYVIYSAVCATVWSWVLLSCTSHSPCCREICPCNDAMHSVRLDQGRLRCCSRQLWTQCWACALQPPTVPQQVESSACQTS